MAHCDDPGIRRGIMALSGLVQNRICSCSRRLLLAALLLGAGSLLHAVAPLAPIFEHGSGFGVISWESENSCFFLSEADGVALIREEMARYGIDLRDTTLVLQDVLPVNAPPPNESLPAPRRSLSLDGNDSARAIAFEYVSFNDANAYRKRAADAPMNETIDILGCARAIHLALSGMKLDTDVVIFYDPVVSRKNLNEEQLADPTRTPKEVLQEHARGLLLQQVRDYLSWLGVEEAAAE